MKDEDLKKLGPIIYLCEGTRSTRQNRGSPEQIELVSSDPFIIKIFLKFLRKIIKIEESRLRGRLQIHNNLDEEKAKVYWSSISRIPIDQFQKSIIKENKSRRRSLNILKNGTFVVRYASKPKYEKLIQMMEKIKLELDH